MTDKKHTKEQIEDLVREIAYTQHHEEQADDFIEKCYMLESFISDLRKQRDELRVALEKCQSCSVFGDPPNYKGALLDLMHIAGEALTKTKESV